MVFRGLKGFFWSMVWIFVILIVGFAILSFLQNKFGGNFIGSAASWVQGHAEP